MTGGPPFSVDGGRKILGRDGGNKVKGKTSRGEFRPPLAPPWKGGGKSPTQKNLTQKSPTRESSSHGQLVQWDHRHLWHPFTQQAEWVEDDPVIITSGRGVYLEDDLGRRYVDGVSSLWVTLHGHALPELNRALAQQARRIAHSTFLGLTHEPAIRLGRELTRLAPGDLSRVFFSDNGSTSVEVALKMAFQYQARRPGGGGRSEFLALQGSYHGDTLGSVSLGGIELFHGLFRPLLFQARFAPAPFCDRCPWRKRPCQTLRTGLEPVLKRAPRPGEARPESGCHWECLAGAEKILKSRGHKLVAAVVEPMVQGASGIRVAPPGYLKGLAKLCRAWGVPLIVDEVATGFGRTGRLFAVEHEGVRPDFLCVAKSLTGGYLPLAATLTTEKVYQAFLGRHEEFRTFFHGHTYTANPLACAVALENLRLMKSRGTLKKLRPHLQTLNQFLRRMADHPGVGSARQMGFMAGLELVQDKAKGTPFPVAWKMGQRVCRAARQWGVWIRPLGDVIVLMPPLGIKANELAALLKGVEKALEQVLRELGDSPRPDTHISQGFFRPDSRHKS